MNLYFAPRACSLATRIALYEAKADIEYTYVDLKTKLLRDGSDYFDINPMGQVPALRTDDGALITENIAVQQYVADQFPAANLAPAGGLARVRLQQWLSFISSELHKATFAPLLDGSAPEGAKAYAREKAVKRLDVLQHHLSGREYLLDDFSVADAYLVTVLNWAPACGIDLAAWPVVREYHRRLLKRPSVAKAVGDERKLFEKEQSRRKAG